jgi:hypothetical protein
MPRTLRQLWAEEDEAHARTSQRRRRRTRPLAKQTERHRGPVSLLGKFS